MSTDRDPGHPGDICLPSSSADMIGEEDDPVSANMQLPLPGNSLLARRLFHFHSYRGSLIPNRRRKREMTPAEKKDTVYWDKRRKNNEAAKRSREKRRLSDLMLEGHLLALNEENAQLRAELLNLQYRMGLGRSDITHPFHSNVPFHPPVQSQLQTSLWGLSAGIPSPDLYQSWPQYSSSSGSPSTSSSQVLSQKNPQRNGTVPPHPLSLFQQDEQPAERSSSETEAASHQQVSSTNDPNEQESSPSQTTSPSSSSSHTTHPTQNWLLTGINHPSNQTNNLLLHWGSPYLRPSPLHARWPQPLPLSLRESDGISNLWNMNGKFSMLSAEISQLRRYLRPENSEYTVMD
ncbi:nuclear factor interleukin-3-regulated protein [Hoplias malabaricus]|uniref:nuclear factor interleukin-3-regulated protein n=1 Tax=Hoplias malabaricus TaxID=27720 RepID=UPI003462BA76